MLFEATQSTNCFDSSIVGVSCIRTLSIEFNYIKMVVEDFQSYLVHSLEMGKHIYKPLLDKREYVYALEKRGGRWASLKS